MGSDFRGLDELIPDVLALVFIKLPLRELLTVVPAVCKSWRTAAVGPYCWQQIDLRQWRCDHYFRWLEQLEEESMVDDDLELDYESTWRHHVDRMLRVLIPRTGGAIQVLLVPYLSNNETLMLIAAYAQSLRNCSVNDGVLERAAPFLSRITTLDLSYCENVGAAAIQSIGKHCRLLTSFYREVEVDYKLPRSTAYIKSPQGDEATAIASTMLGPKDLRIRGLRLYTKDAEMIIENCKHLEYLNIACCWFVELGDAFLKRFPKLEVDARCIGIPGFMNNAFVSRVCL